MCAEFRSPSHLSGLNRTASLSGADRTESLSVSGSNSQLNNSNPAHQYTPDFYVRALSDLQFAKVGYTFTVAEPLNCTYDTRDGQKSPN